MSRPAGDPRGERGPRRARPWPKGWRLTPGHPMARLLRIVRHRAPRPRASRAAATRTRRSPSPRPRASTSTSTGRSTRSRCRGTMNPNDVEDTEYLIGLPESSPPPTEDEIYFGVWVRVENPSRTRRCRPPPSGRSTTPRTTSTGRSRSTRTSTRSPSTPVDVPPKTVLPLASSAAGQGPIQGSLLLFKIKNESFQNRLLELRFSNGGGGQEGAYDLDVVGADRRRHRGRAGACASTNCRAAGAPRPRRPRPGRSAGRRPRSAGCGPGA